MGSAHRPGSIDRRQALLRETDAVAENPATVRAGGAVVRDA